MPDLNFSPNITATKVLATFHAHLAPMSRCVIYPCHDGTKSKRTGREAQGALLKTENDDMKVCTQSLHALAQLTTIEAMWFPQALGSAE